MKRGLTFSAVALLTGLAVACGGDEGDSSPGNGDGDASAGDGDGSTGDGDGASGDGDGATGDGDGSTGDGDGSTGDGDGSTGDGDGSTGDGDGSTGDGDMVNPCDPVDSGDPTCTDCALEACGADYRACLGENFEDGDFSGGLCESYMDCVADCGSGDVCDDSCAADCQIDVACSNCFLSDVGGCLLSNCASECGAGDIDIDIDFEAGCAELQACCDSMTGTDAENCEQTIAAAAGVDLVCGVAYTTFEALGQCGG